MNFDDELKNYKHTIKGKDYFIFLVNDFNKEIQQHYDSNYEFTVDIPKLRESIISKINYCNNKKINYSFFVIPDRSIVLKDYLPWDVDEPKRILPQLEDICEVLPLYNMCDFMPTDTHMTFLSAVKVVTFILNYMHPEKSLTEYSELLWEHLTLDLSIRKGDLISITNWSYDVRDEYYKKYNELNLYKVFLKESYDNLYDDLPDEFKIVKRRETIYLRNENSISDKKLLSFGSSSNLVIKIPLLAYYREIICYWDHWYFNPDLVDWFEPDDIIELRVERFLENPLYPIVKEDNPVNIPLIVDFVNYFNQDDVLTVVLDIKDFHLMPVNTTCNIRINDILSKEYELNGIKNTFEIDINDLENKMYYLTIHINESDKTLDYEYKIPVSKMDSGLYIPVYINIEGLTVHNNVLNIKTSFADYAMAAVDNYCEFFVDNVLVHTMELNKKFAHRLNLDISNLKKGNHKLNIRLPQSKMYKEANKEVEFKI